LSLACPCKTHFQDPGGAVTTLDDYRVVVEALDRIEGSPIASGPLPPSPRLKLLTAEIRERVEQLRNDVEEHLFEEHGRLGFESEKVEAQAEPKRSPAEDRAEDRAEENRGVEKARLLEAVLSSSEPTSALAGRLGISQAYVARIRREAGERCAFHSGSGLTAQQRDEIARSPEPTRVLAARHRVSEALVNKIRKSGLQGALCAPAGTSKDI
jgi:hypothetical protein